jgi:hypothetical protein
MKKTLLTFTYQKPNKKEKSSNVDISYDNLNIEWLLNFWKNFKGVVHRPQKNADEIYFGPEENIALNHQQEKTDEIYFGFMDNGNLYLIGNTKFTVDKPNPHINISRKDLILILLPEDPEKQNFNIISFKSITGYHESFTKKFSHDEYHMILFFAEKFLELTITNPEGAEKLIENRKMLDLNIF